MADPVPSPEIVDITDDFAPQKPENRIYRSEAGYIVKIKTYERAGSPPNIIVLEMTPSLCHDTGKAQDHPTIPDEYWIGQEHLVQMFSQGELYDDEASSVPHKDKTPITPAQFVLLSHHRLVRETESAAIKRASLDSIPGLAPKP